MFSLRQTVHRLTIVGTALGVNLGKSADRLAAISRFRSGPARATPSSTFIRGIGIVWGVLGVALVAVGLRQ